MNVDVLNGRVPRFLTRFSLDQPPPDLERSLTEGFETILDQTLRFVAYCQCGGRTSRLLGSRANDVLGEPVALECISCRRITTLFDANVDGYNAEVGALEGAATTRAEPRDAHACSACGGNELTPAVLVTYQGDEEDFREVGAPLENLFDVFAIAAKCAACGAASRVTDVFECA